MSMGVGEHLGVPAARHPSRRESEFKKPAHAPQNGRVHHRPSYPYNKANDLMFSCTGHPSRRESEFKKPAHAPQNGRVHHRPSYPYNKSESLSSTSAPAHRPPPLRISNGFQPPSSSIDSSQLPIESILKEMKSLPTPLSVIAATPRKELDNKFIFNPYTNKVQENPQLANNDLKTPVTKSAPPALWHNDAG
ncbi:hypothetical protein RR48_05806 [Papilio machaon]|uniref:Uncharacterized protein n=1 Tax=Papilio machaon TaxID=76193 RepID=A0A0N1IJC3_PAPMA|nr:hypothetical protein RR48_05806 [Papilio machaon]